MHLPAWMARLEAGMAECEALPASHFLRGAERVAAALLGHLLLRRTREGWCGGIIVETEAYVENDPASHGYRGRTERNQAMFGPPGHAYVYFIYGNHYCFNVVCREPGVPEAVLVRAIEPVLGVEEMMERRRVSGRVQVSNGPGKLCQALSIGRECDGLDLCDGKGELRIASNPWLRACRRHLGPVITTPRIGISRAADWPLRFFLRGSAHVSRA